jgi:hypothetical protein
VVLMIIRPNRQLAGRQRAQEAKRHDGRAHEEHIVVKEAKNKNGGAKYLTAGVVETSEVRKGDEQQHHIDYEP